MAGLSGFPGSVAFTTRSRELRVSLDLYLQQQYFQHMLQHQPLPWSVLGPTEAEAKWRFGSESQKYQFIPKSQRPETVFSTLLQLTSVKRKKKLSHYCSNYFYFYALLSYSCPYAIDLILLKS